MIEVTNLTKQYAGVAAIQDVTFRASAGEILGFLGPNGAGKSTTMRILAGCLAPTGGDARIAGFDVFEESLKARKSLGYLPEMVPLYPEMKVEEYLSFTGRLHGMERASTRSRMTEVMGRCGLLDVRRKLIGSLSRGYRQRVGLAQALLHDPPVLILDEPTVGLDPRQIIEIRELIRTLAGSHTLLLSTHILPEVSMICSRVLIIHRGRIAANLRLDRDGSVELLPAPGAESSERSSTDPELSRRAPRLRLQVEGPTPDLVESLKSLPGVRSVLTDPDSGGEEAGSPLARFHLELDGSSEAQQRAIRRSIAARVTGLGCGLLEMSLEQLTLEEIFVRVTAREKS